MQASEALSVEQFKDIAYLRIWLFLSYSYYYYYFPFQLCGKLPRVLGELCQRWSDGSHGAGTWRYRAAAANKVDRRYFYRNGTEWRICSTCSGWRTRPTDFLFNSIFIQLCILGFFCVSRVGFVVGGVCGSLWWARACSVPYYVRQCAISTPVFKTIFPCTLGFWRLAIEDLSDRYETAL